MGSILAITDALGTILEERQFGAWGTVDQFRASDGSTEFSHSSLLGRGYTGHEHFFEVGLIHMNGRMYDPVMGRFLSPDNYVQDPYNTQNFNRYGYVLNNPLVFSDPSGELVETEPNYGAYWIAAAVVNSFASSYDWLREQGVFRDINRWFNKHIKEPVDSFFDWIHGRKKKRRTVAPPTRKPLPNGAISMDPLVRSNANVNPILTSSGGGSSGINISAGEVLRTGADFVPFVGSSLDVYEGIQNGSGSQIALGAGFFILDALTLGGASLVKGAIKTGVKVAGRTVGRVVRRGSKNIINVAEGGIPRIQNAANRINKPIHLVGSRANGTSKALSDFDYVIDGINSRQWSKIKNSLPGAPSRIDNLPRRIDIFRGPLDTTKPHITINPR